MNKIACHIVSILPKKVWIICFINKNIKCWNSLSTLSDSIFDEMIKQLICCRYLCNFQIWIFTCIKCRIEHSRIIKFLYKRNWRCCDCWFGVVVATEAPVILSLNPFRICSLTKYAGQFSSSKCLTAFEIGVIVFYHEWLY